ncbi:predicted protein [Sclerotinia sclerotiorum 1980 UF-70]|uniref:Uncharacterized protein n=2 Tax=Sclerotinia sclerotiorum (strain ATCC 18683 / 1980 / Ss-1) TaxID=665079 RepID=A7E9J2_SCLS1|nr:predicted protein [Sclerotinia sclerotiorum 1980 UF-70]APA05694.1 hypothetical protein sscle_01g004640 [Sclerotinia sclerotiorum 1980 UF-70]EDN97044.1 predicted protein [Sclerotinia sclerotiorum 1980 UF-70]
MSGAFMAASLESPVSKSVNGLELGSPATDQVDTREARYVAEKFYNLCFPTQSNPTNIYIRFDRDVIYFANWLTGYKYETNGWFEHVNIGPIGKKGLGRHELRSIQRVAVSSVYFNVPESSPPGADVEYFSFSVLPVLSRFPSLKRLVVVFEDIGPYQEGEITLHGIPKHFHIDPAFCAFCEVSKIVEGFKDLKRNLNSPWRVFAVIVAAGARDRQLPHVGQYQYCACNGFTLRQDVGCPNRTCEEYHPESVKVAGLVPEGNGMSEVTDDDLPEEEWRLSEDELDELIADEEFY